MHWAWMWAILLPTILAGGERRRRGALELNSRKLAECEMCLQTNIIEPQVRFSCAADDETEESGECDKSERVLRCIDASVQAQCQNLRSSDKRRSHLLSRNLYPGRWHARSLCTQASQDQWQYDAYRILSLFILEIDLRNLVSTCLRSTSPAEPLRLADTYSHVALLDYYNDQMGQQMDPRRLTVEAEMHSLLGEFDHTLSAGFVAPAYGQKQSVFHSVQPGCNPFTQMNDARRTDLAGRCWMSAVNSSLTCTKTAAANAERHKSKSTSQELAWIDAKILVAFVDDMMEQFKKVGCGDETAAYVTLFLVWTISAEREQCLPADSIQYLVGSASNSSLYRFADRRCQQLNLEALTKNVDEELPSPQSIDSPVTKSIYKVSDASLLRSTYFCSLLVVPLLAYAI